MTCTDASRTEFKSWKTFMMPSTACVSLSFVTSTDSGSRSDNPCRRSCPFLKSRLTPDKFRIMVLGTGQTLLGHLEQETVEYCFPFSYLHKSTMQEFRCQATIRLCVRIVKTISALFGLTQCQTITTLAARSK